MKKIAFITMVVFSIALSAEAARKGSRRQSTDPRPTSTPCTSYGCNDDGYESDDQSSNETYGPSSGTFEGNDRNTGSEYINGMPY